MLSRQAFYIVGKEGINLIDLGLPSDSQAQYFKNPEDMDTYRSRSIFLPVINNEVPGQRNPSFAEAIRKLEKLVLVR